MTLALRLVFALAALLPAFGSRAQPAAGIDYRELERAQPVASPGSEVIEFFWYRCPHCYEFEPSLERWAAKLPPGALLTRIPVVFDAEWAIDARIFYALRAIGEEERLRTSLYDAIHLKGGRRRHREQYQRWVEEWLSSQGVDMAGFRAALASSTVREAVERARRMTAAYGVEGTPTLAIDGRYIVDADSGDHNRMLAVTSYLLNRARQGAR